MTALRGYDAWLQRGYDEPTPLNMGDGFTTEDFVGGRVVVDGEWGTIQSWEEEVDRDEDGVHGMVYYEVRLDSGGTASLDEFDAALQLIPLRSRR